MASAILEVCGLWVGDGPGAVVQDVSFVVGAGQVLGVHGGPRAGKSSLLRCLGLDYPPTRGRILLQGEEVSGAPAERRSRIRSRRIELVHPPAPEGPRVGSVAPDGAGLRRPGWRPPTVPGAGMRQRIQVAKALTDGAEVLLLDEPFAGVEPAVARRVLELLCRVRETGTAVVLATRDPALCRELAGEVLVLDQGTVAAHGPTATVLAGPLPVAPDRRSA